MIYSSPMHYKIFRALHAFFSIPVVLGLIFSPNTLHADTMGSRAMAVTADSHATRAAYEVLQKGGNAVDAAIAAQWVLNVVEPQSSGIGGGGFFLYYDAAAKRIYAFDGREKAPEESHPEMFLEENGRPCQYKPDCITGGRPVGVPGVLKLLQHVYDRFGSKKFSFGELFDPGIKLAEDGFPISPRLAHFIKTEKDRLNHFESSKKVFLDSFGRPLLSGTLLVQPDLAATFRTIQKQGTTAFYEGEIAEDIVDAVRKSPLHRGNMKKTDLMYYEVKVREPVQGTYRGYDFFSMSPPSSGGTTLIEALNILEIYPMTSKARTADGVHLFSEAQKLAFQDRNESIGDPDFVKVPVMKLISKKYAAERAELIKMDSVIRDDETPSKTPPMDAPNTTHISIVDEQGNMAAFTSTIEDIFGSALMVPGRGFFLNNELTDFDLEPKNARGKLKANAPEGEKRPRSSMTPTFIFKQGKPVLVLGSPGGSKIIGIILNLVVNVLDFGMSIEAAMAAPRVINRAGSIEMEPNAYDMFELRRELERRGHSVVRTEAFGNAQAIYINPDSGVMTGVSDLRGEGEAAGY